MVYTEHEPFKPEKVVGVAAAALEQNLVIAAPFAREGIEPFKGSKDDTINVTVDGVLPYRTYGWRNNRSAPLQFDVYKERKVARSFGDDLYSGVELTDEQATMDFDGWTKLAGKQVEAIGRGYEVKATRAIEDAPYEVHVVLSESDLRGSLNRLKVVFDRLQVPGNRTLYVGDDLEIALLDDDKLNLASNVGDAEAETALREATLGRRSGFNFVKAQHLSDMNYGLFDSGFVFITAAPPVPQSAGFGATASTPDGTALRWVRAFDINYGVEKSVFMAYHSFDVVRDILVGLDEDDQAYVSEDEHFVRGVRVELGSTFSVEVSNPELSAISGIVSTDGTSDGA